MQNIKKLISKWIKRTSGTRDLAQLRSFKAIMNSPKKMERYDRIFTEISAVSRVPLNLESNAAFGLIPASFSMHLDIFLRQYLTDASLFADILPGVLRMAAHDGETAAFAMPSIWRDYLKDRNINVDDNASRYAFRKLQWRSFFKGIRRFARLAVGGLAYPASISNNSVVFIDLPAKVVAAHCQDEGVIRQSLITWFMAKGFISSDRVDIRFTSAHQPAGIVSDDVAAVPCPHGRLPNIVRWFEFLARGSAIVFCAAIRGLLGAWWAPVVAADAIELAYVQCLGPKNIACAYIFNNSSWFFRPLWTYFANAAGSRLIMLFYSANISPFRYRSGRKCPTFIGYNIMNWPEYAVWNEQQAQFVRSVSGQFIRMINVCGPVPFIDSGEKIQDLPANSIAVFSVAAQRSSSLARRGVLPEYYSSDSIVQFLEQSYQAISRINGTMVLKTKRQSLSGDDRAYLDYVETLAKRSNVICIDSDVAAARLIERTNASISIPFTSTALVAESFGKPACYYDAARLLDVSYKGHEGVEFFSDALSVESWLSRVMDDPSPLKSLA
jgi:hypothetical protein